MIPLTPPNKLVIEVKASGRYREITWSKDGLPFGNDSSAGMFIVDRPNELHNFAEIFVRGDTSESDLGTYTVQLTAFDDSTQTRIPDSIEFHVILPREFQKMFTLPCSYISKSSCFKYQKVPLASLYTKLCSFCYYCNMHTPFNFNPLMLRILQFHPLQPTWPLPPSLPHPSPSPGSSQLWMLLTDMT